MAKRLDTLSKQYNWLSYEKNTWWNLIMILRLFRHFLCFDNSFDNSSDNSSNNSFYPFWLSILFAFEHFVILIFIFHADTVWSSMQE